MEKLKRQTFETSRLLEFFSEKELTMQMGHSVEDWPIAIMKELIDNALDGCESAGIAPVIKVVVDGDKFSVEDNGPGIPVTTIIKSLDYTVRVSDKSHYVSPTRGQLGNALKTIYAAPFVANGERGVVEIETRGKKHTIEISLDRISQQPVMDRSVESSSINCTKVTVYWENSASSLNRPRVRYSWEISPITSVRDLVLGYAMFNPHLSIILDMDGEATEHKATVTKWSKWDPSNPTSPHWYNPEQLRNLIAAYLTLERNTGEKRTVREFVSEFRGLARTQVQKAVLEQAKLKNKRLEHLVEGKDVSMAKVERLLAAMQEHSKKVRPSLLGEVGKKNMSKVMARYHHVQPQSIKYKKIVGFENSLPHITEVVFGVYAEEHEDDNLLVVTGLNWGPTMGVPMPSFRSYLGSMRIDPHDPVCVVMHIARPRFDFIDRGKGVINV